jgi:hypothetical protein
MGRRLRACTGAAEARAGNARDAEFDLAGAPVPGSRSVRAPFAEKGTAAEHGENPAAVVCCALAGMLKNRLGRLFMIREIRLTNAEGAATRKVGVKFSCGNEA